MRGGKPCMRGTRTTVGDVLEHMATGMSDAEILADFPDLRPERLGGVGGVLDADMLEPVAPPSAGHQMPKA